MSSTMFSSLPSEVKSPQSAEESNAFPMSSSSSPSATQRTENFLIHVDRNNSHGNDNDHATVSPAIDIAQPPLPLPLPLPSRFQLYRVCFVVLLCIILILVPLLASVGLMFSLLIVAFTSTCENQYPTVNSSPPSPSSSPTSSPPSPAECFCCLPSSMRYLYLYAIFFCLIFILKSFCRCITPRRIPLLADRILLLLESYFLHFLTASQMVFSAFLIVFTMVSITYYQKGGNCVILPIHFIYFFSTLLLLFVISSALFCTQWKIKIPIISRAYEFVNSIEVVGGNNFEMALMAEVDELYDDPVGDNENNPQNGNRHVNPRGATVNQIQMLKSYFIVCKEGMKMQSIKERVVVLPISVKQKKEKQREREREKEKQKSKGKSLIPSAVSTDQSLSQNQSIEMGNVHVNISNNMDSAALPQQNNLNGNVPRKDSSSSSSSSPASPTTPCTPSSSPSSSSPTCASPSYSYIPPNVNPNPSSPPPPCISCLSSPPPPHALIPCPSSLDVCSICLECFRPHQMVMEMPRCGHTFHQNCLETWLRRAGTCPFCRNRLQ